ncbi:MAG: hypothetical protein ACO3R5_04460 [Pseudohongiellaceae bacterium]
MKYAVWFLRLLFASWMIPAGINHFFPLFPQPMGNAPLSMALIIALLDSHLFDLVKAVELVAGVMVLFGWYTPLALLICLPVSFGVFYWDAPLEGWTSGASRFGYAVILCNTLLCLAWLKSYQGMLTRKAEAGYSLKPVQVGRIILGVILVFFAANTLILGMWPAPSGTQPLADLLMTALTNSRLLHVALAFQLVAGLLILSGFLVPLALYVQMCISVNALYWALFLDHQLFGGLLTLVAFALNGLLMLAYLPSYKGVLERHANGAGESDDDSGNYDALMVNWLGTTSRTVYCPAMATIIAVYAFYFWVGVNGTVQFSILVLLFPLLVLLARRLRDMGRPPALGFAPLLLLLAAFAVQYDYVSLGGIDTAVVWLALLVTAVLIGWGAATNGKTAAPASS